MVITTIVYIPNLVSRSVKIITVNPATEEILAEYDALTEEQVNHEVNDSRKVYESIWKKFDISERAKLLRNLGHMLQQRKKEYATIITNEMGKPITESLAEVEKCSWVCEYYADNGGKFLEAGFPKGVFRHLVGNYVVGEALARANVDAVSITGSTRAGKRVAEIASQQLHKFILELGGSDPFIVLKDANIDKAAEIGVKSRFLNNGQSCIAAKRFIVEQDVIEEFTKKFIENVEKQVVGDPLDPKTTIGPLVRDNSRDTIVNQIGQSALKGSKVLLGGNVPQMKGYFFNPTVIGKVTPDMSISREEVFGPVAPIIAARNPTEAIRFANDTEFGLGSSIWSEKFAKENNLVKDIEAGMVFVNSMVISDPRIPFGGIKNSGIGRELSNYGLKEFVNIKSVIMN